MKINLKIISTLASEPFNDLHFAFGPQSIKDPETGEILKSQGYDEEKNYKLINYIAKVDSTFICLSNCISDIFFFEEILSPDFIPGFNEKEKFSEYLKIQYQHWVIKLGTCYDCVLRALNATFELGLFTRFVNEKTVGENSNISDHENICIHLNNLTKLLTKKLKEINSRISDKSLKGMRNEIVHSNEFAHTEVDDVSTSAFVLQMELTEISNVDFQNQIGRSSLKMVEEINNINIKLLSEVYPLLRHMNDEYKKRFNEKLVQ